MCASVTVAGLPAARVHGPPTGVGGGCLDTVLAALQLVQSDVRGYAQNQRRPRPSRQEQVASDLIARILPADGHYRLWVSLDVIASSGEIFELDLLVLGHHALYLIDIKGWHGRISGDGESWSLARPDGTERRVRNPVPRLHRQARQLARALVLEEPALVGLRIEPLLFVPDGTLGLQGREILDARSEIR